MKADLINTKYGIAIQITALSTGDKMKLAAFMQQRKNAHKPRLKILHSPDHSEILNIGFVLPVNEKYRVALSITKREGINLSGYDKIAFPGKLNGVYLYSPIKIFGNRQLVINIGKELPNDTIFAAVADEAEMTLTFLQRVYSVADIEKLKREF